MNRLVALAAMASLLAASGCTVGGVRRTDAGNGYDDVKTYECDWPRGSGSLSRGKAPNSIFLPATRADRFGDYAMFAVPIVLVFDLFYDFTISPFVYLTGRDCRVTSEQTVYVGTPASRRRELEQKAAQERAAADAQAAAAAEAAKIQALYPPLSDSPRSVGTHADDFALIVGIEGYRSVPKADYGEGDASLVKSYLESLGVPPGNVVLLTGEHASRSDVMKYLEEWLPGVVKTDSRVYFYYSGHGAPDPASGAAYLVPWDGDPQFLKSTALPLAKLYADLAALPDRESVVILDSCFSGAGGRSLLASGARPLVNVQEDSSAPAKTTIFAASGGNQIAGGFDLRRHGLFTYFLLRGLAGEADANHDGHVTAQELQDYLTAHVGEAARRFSNRDQTPHLLGDSSLRLY